MSKLSPSGQGNDSPAIRLKDRISDVFVARILTSHEIGAQTRMLRVQFQVKVRL